MLLSRLEAPDLEDKIARQRRIRKHKQLSVSVNKFNGQNRVKHVITELNDS